MNNEIKEILDMLKDSQYIPSDDYRTYKLLDRDDTRNLLDYITNLQQDTEMYAQLKDEYEEEIKDLQQENERLKDIVVEKDEDINHIAEEIADVMVMLKQFQYYYGIEDKQVEDIMQYKIDRQLDRIEKEKNNEC